MRLYHVRTGELREFWPDEIPPYAIASHRWIRGEEASFHDFQGPSNRKIYPRSKYNNKLEGFAAFVKTHLPHLEWIWIDTCCINKADSTELSEAIISMCKWYRGAELCLAYLADVESPDDMEAFRQSEWFRRGWTLQELLAPQTVLFLTHKWELIGHKGRIGPRKNTISFDTGPVLTPHLIAATGIPEKVLNNFNTRADIAIDEKLKWIEARRTTRPEDMTYSLLGIFNVFMPILYGEGSTSARKRFLREIRQADENAWVLASDRERDTPKSLDNKADMLKAPSDGDPDAIHAIRREFPSIIHASNDQGQTPLHLAVLGGQFEMVQYLIRNGAGINPTDTNGRLPLHEAIEGGNLSIIQALVAKGADASAKDINGRSPRDLCDSSSLIAWILDHGADLEVRDRNNFTALCHFANRGNVQAVHSLLNMGANIEAYGREHHNALFEAVGQDRQEVAKSLIARGANVHVLDHHRNTSLIWAGLLGHTRIGEILLDNDADINAQNVQSYTSLCECCENGRQVMGFMLLRRGADFSICNNAGWAPLIIAGKHGHVDLVREMLDLGDDIDRQVQDSGGTTLHHASAMGRQEVVDLLLSRNANVGICDSDFATPLFRACEAGQLDCVKSLLEAGAYINQPNKHRSTVIHIAAWHGHMKVVQLLLEVAAERKISILDVRDQHGDTPLGLAARRGDANIAVVLLEVGKANINAVRNDGWTSLAIACFYNHPEVVEVLLDRGVNTDIKLNSGWTARDLAAMQGNDRILRLFDSKSSSMQDVTNMVQPVVDHEAKPDIQF